jgi:hypothetical protein
MPFVQINSTSFPKVCSIHPRRLTWSGSFEDRLRKAESSMVASTIPKTITYHGKKDTSGKHFLF